MRKRKQRPFSHTFLGIAWYRPEEWSRLLEIASDRDKLETTYGEWLSGAETRLRELSKAGIQAVKVDIDVEELLQWCRAQDSLVDGNARAQFTAHELRQLHQGSR